MRASMRATLRSTALPFLVGAIISLGHPPAAAAQQAAPETAPAPAAREAAPEAAAPTAGDVAEAALLTEEELDGLVAPIALYPDALLAQIFVASTFPLDVVKAARWAEENKEMAKDARADAADAEGWDPSVAVLAAGFPDVIGKMADDLDQTELLGDALLVQSDDVLAAVQRQRARADAMGNLTSNDAQTVTVEGDNIAIAPADPEVVYVPAYDGQAVYTTPAPAVIETTSYPTGTAYPATTTVVEDDDDTGALIATGLLSFGAGLLVSEIFDDDDWGDYWGPSYGAIGWGGGYVRPYPGYGGGNVNIGNDINIDRDRDRDRIRVDGDGNWRPSVDPRRDDARNKIADRRGIREGERPQPRAGTREADRAQLRQKLDAKGGGAQAREALLGGGAGAAIAGGAAGAGLGLAAQRRPADRQSAISDRKGGLTGANRAADRGRQSASRAGIAKRDAARPGGGKRQEVARGGGRQQIARGGSRPTAKRSSGGGRSAFAGGGGGRKAGAAKSRGAKSRGGRGGGGRSGGGRGRR